MRSNISLDTDPQLQEAASPPERVHVHVAHPDGEAKFWLTPHVVLATQTGLSVKQQG
jgi:hypothetical protein